MYDKEFFKELADKYETKDFISNDPIQFPRKLYDAGADKRDVEISAFITSWLSYGNRKQIIKATVRLHDMMDWKLYDYLMSQEWRELKGNEARLYRFNTYGDYAELLERLYAIYNVCNDLEDTIINIPKEGIDGFKYTARFLNMCNYIERLQVLFGGIFGIPALCGGSACKRLAMFLRWMIRKDSPVDMGIWEQCQPEKLIIPLDTHVHQQALKMGITKRKSVDMRTAKEITDFFADIFPYDPARGDFALFGYGVNNINLK